MREHYLDVRCDCEASRAIFLRKMARDSRFAGSTLAHVALSLSCACCHDGSDQVHLTATSNGIVPAPTVMSLVWTLALVERHGGGAIRVGVLRQC